MPKRLNSRSKGKRGELELAQWLRDVWGISARRGQQFAGSPDSPDIVHSLPGVHIECKRQERLVIENALDQAMRDKAPGTIGIVLHRRNRSDWVVSMWGKDATAFAWCLMKAMGCLGVESEASATERPETGDETKGGLPGHG